MNESRTRRDIEGSRRLIEFFAIQGERAWRNKDAHQAVAWVVIAAEHAWGFHAGYFANPRLERLLVQIAPTLETAPDAPSLWDGARPGQKRVLHVLTTAYKIGGHSRTVERWVRSGVRQGEVHSVVLMEQGDQAISPTLSAAVEAGGGLLVKMNESDLLARAALLRAWWQNGTDRVVLSCHPHDPVPLLAFGVTDGPPILMINAADHTFWLGVAIADVVLNSRRCGRDCSLRRRGVKRSEYFALPLEEVQPSQGREATRQHLGIPLDACVLLTVGSAYKYAPLPPWDFPRLIAQVLERKTNVHLVAAGPRDGWGWAELVARFPGRVHALGSVPDLSSLHEAADLYLDSFPFTSLTAVLEAGLAGLPIHLSHNNEAPLMSCEDRSLDHLPSYSDAKEYVEALFQLIESPDQWASIAEQAKKKIHEVHVSPRWAARAHELLNLPGTHTVNVPDVPLVVEGADLQWAAFQHQVSFLKHFGLGLNGFKTHRHFLSPASRLITALRVSLGYPHHLKRPRLGARILIEVLRSS